MAGIAPIKIHTYNNSGKFIKTYDNSVEFSKAYNVARSYVANTYKEYGVMGNGDVWAKSKIGRVSVKQMVRELNSEFVRKNDVDDKYEVECYNLKGVLIATFRSEFYLRKIFPNLTGNINYNQYGKVSGLKFVKKFN